MSQVKIKRNFRVVVATVTTATASCFRSRRRFAYSSRSQNSDVALPTQSSWLSSPVFTKPSLA